MSVTRTNVSRRRFMQASAVGTSALLLPQVHVSGQEAKPEQQKLNIGIIGTGGRGQANLGGVQHENIYALCDTNGNVIDQARSNYPKAKVTSDWRELVEDPQIDAVVISTADHHHALASIAAMRAGKHVYCEKPLAHTVREARLMQQVYAEQRGKIATQMGTQIHATDNYRRVVELVQAGAIGPIREAHVWCGRTINPVDPVELPEQSIPANFDWETWLGPAAMRPYNGGYWQGGNLNWNRRWEFGNGVLGDMGSHLIDLPYWALELTHPESVESEGPAIDEFACPPWQVVTWQHPARSGNEYVSGPLKVVWYHGNEGMQRRSDLLQPQLGDDTNLADWHIGVTFVGDKGLLTADYGRHLLSPSGEFADYTPPAPSIEKSAGHYHEWTNACKSGGESLCNFEYSGRLIEHNLLGNVAHRAGKKLTWDAESATITNVPEAMQFVDKEYRDGWKV
ncbi:Gfo/Idh/MocA family protein [Aeoliella mucimassa]|uniref:Inositol 2-dehydrogenase n=1 Tax=Aeoliella mucimassa TaxID=2527972 RepID=A0A518AGU6_9BACT|nr:Gfo/Idh/MocA family oxidoreductase [Aeoliella mucimassa]QDU53951.1 Inositol 2-dehydrogenase [Aeoliella mucimassa]